MPRPALLLLAAFFLVILLAVPGHAAHAQSRVFPTGYWGPLLSCTGNYNGVVQESGPLRGKICKDFCDLLHTTQNVVDFAMTLVIFVGAPGMLAFGGAMFLVSGASGAEESRTMAKDIVVSALIGVGITLGAYLMLSTFLWLFGNGPDSAIQVSWPNIDCVVPPIGAT